MGDPILWAGFVMATGLAGAALARSLRAPAATGALVAGLCWAVTSADPSLLPAAPSLLHALGIAFFGFLAGAELDPSGLMRRGRRLAAKSLAQGLAVAPLACLAALAMGLETRAAVSLGAVAAAASPVAIVAVASEARARGDFTRDSLALSSISLLMVTAVVSFAFGPHGAGLALVAGVVAAACCGLLILMP